MIYINILNFVLIIGDEKKTNFLLYKKLFGCLNDCQLLNEYILHNFFYFLSNIIHCQEQLKTIQQTEKKNALLFSLLCF